MLFIQSRTYETSGTSKDFSSSKSSAIPISAKAANLEYCSTSMHTLPSSMKKKSLPKRSITFANLPMNLKKHSDCIAYPCYDKAMVTKQLIQPLQETLAYPSRVTSYETPARFQLPPTLLTVPECWRNLDTSASFSKRQIARSVNGNRVEVGFRSMSNMYYLFTLDISMK